MTVTHIDELPESRRRTLRSTDAELESAIRKALEDLDTAPVRVRPVAEALRSLTLRGGKRIRGRLCILGYECIRGRPAPPSVITFAAGVEILHAFMLVHDDLIDCADVRRGGPSVHAALRESAEMPGDVSASRHLAMLGGDLLFALAAQTMIRARVSGSALRRATQFILGSARDAAFGECLDVLYETQPIAELTGSEIAEVLRLKTARYTFEAPLVAGAMLARASDTTLAALAGFGGRLGVAFQLVDDLMDLYSDPAATGKPRGGDIRQRKRTALVQLAIERASDSERRRLMSLYASDVVTDDDVEWASERIRASGAASEMTSRIRQLVDVALSSLAGASLSASGKRQLIDFAHRVASQVNEIECQSIAEERAS